MTTPKSSKVSTTPKSSKVLTTPKSSTIMRTRTSENHPKIDDAMVEESWNRKRHKKISYFNKTLLRRIVKVPSHLTKMLQKPAKHQAKRKNAKTYVNRLRNNLISNPETYLQPSTNFVVASSGSLLLDQNGYQLLAGEKKLTNHFISFVLSLYAREHDSLEFEIYKDESVICTTQRRLIKLKKPIIFAVYHLNEHFMLIIINCK